jgi:hypothetical protein
MSVTASDLAAFERRGFVRLPGVFSGAAAARMCEQVWDDLARRYGIRRDDRTTWTVPQPRHFQALCQAGVFDALGSPALAATLDDLLGAGAWECPQHWGQPLVTFPGADVAWDVPHAQWHIDWPARGAPRPLFGAKILAFMAPVAARGGGTVVLAGSHRLVERFVATSRPGTPGNSPAIRRALGRSHPWLCDLWSRPGRSDRTGRFRAASARHTDMIDEPCTDRIRRFMNDGGTIDGVEVRVVELTGTAGEAIVFHPWLFHAPAPNCTTAPRMMVGQNVHTDGGIALFAPPGR